MSVQWLSTDKDCPRSIPMLFAGRNFDDIGRLKINGDYIVALVGAQQGLPVINKITDESGSQKCKISKIDYSEANAGIGEYMGQEAGQKRPAPKISGPTLR